MTSRTTRWRKRQRIKEKMRTMVTNQQLIHSSQLSSSSGQLSIDIDISSQDTNLNRFSTSAFQSEDFLSPSFSVDSVHTGHTLGLDDESSWLNMIDDDVDTLSKLDVSYDLEVINDDGYEYFDNWDEPMFPTEKELGVAMAILKIRHRLSNKCIDDICTMMRLSNGSHCPANFEAIKRLITLNPSSNLPANNFFICAICSSISISSDHCSNSECTDSKAFTQQPFECMTMSIVSQLQDILKRETKLIFYSQNEQDRQSSNEKIRDIHDGDIYRKIIANENGAFLSFTMNMDGIQVSKSSSQSLWIITLAINEIRRRERFKMKNIIIGGIISSNMKPSHKQIEVFLQPIVSELVQGCA